MAYGQNEVVSIDKQEINTQVFAKDGETIVLGGVFHDTITKGVDKVPLLGDIPGIKRLFSKESERHQKRELVIFVTPHILKQGERMEMAKKEKHFKQVEKQKNKVRSISLMFSHFFNLAVCIASDLFILVEMDCAVDVRSKLNFPLLWAMWFTLQHYAMGCGHCLKMNPLGIVL